MLIRKGKKPARLLQKARILLNADVPEADDGFEAVLSRNHRAMLTIVQIFDGEKEAKLIALGCFRAAPQGTRCAGSCGCWRTRLWNSPHGVGTNSQFVHCE